MAFGRLSCARTLLAFVLVSFCGMRLTAFSQETPAPSPGQNTVPGLPAAQPLSQAAVGTVPHNNPPAANAQNNSFGAPTSFPENPSQLRLGAGDLLEVGVYNVPELTTKARVGNSGDIYLPLIDYVHVGDLTVEEAQTLIQ